MADEKHRKVKASARLHPAKVDVAIPSPVVAGSPFQAPRLWHAAHANNLRRMMARMGYEELNYVEAANDGKGAVLTLGSYAADAVPGVIPTEVQAYLDQHLSGRFLETLRAFVRSAKGIIDIIDDIYPPAAVVVTPVVVALEMAEDALDSLEEEEGE